MKWEDGDTVSHYEVQDSNQTVGLTGGNVISFTIEIDCASCGFEGDLILGYMPNKQQLTSPQVLLEKDLQCPKCRVHLGVIELGTTFEN